LSPRVRKRGGTPSGRPSPRNPRRQSGAGPTPRERTATFWGDAAALPPAEREVRITQDPSAVPRSLGQPPLPGREAVSEYYFATVYDRAVTLAGALAAAGGLISPEELAEERAD
jgi:hypothetical protein